MATEITLEFCRSSDFQTAIDESLQLTRGNHPKESGFCCWINAKDEVLHINKPVLGQDYQISGHYQRENDHQPFTGFWQGEASQMVLDFHTHPALGPGRKNYGPGEEWLLAPSIDDLAGLLYQLRTNITIAELVGKKRCVNPVMTIGSPDSSKLSFLQIDPRTAREVKFRSGNLWKKGVWSMFEKYCPQHAKRHSGSIWDLFGADGDDSSTPDLMGSVFNVPRFLRTSTVRYREFLSCAGITWIVADRDNPPLQLKLFCGVRDKMESLYGQQSSEDAWSHLENGKK